MQYNLFNFISELNDPRRGQGQRHSLENVLVIVLMAILSGHQGLKGFARFAKSNARELSEVLQLKHGVPTYGTFRSVLLGLDEHVLASRFITWVQGCHGSFTDERVALDGKLLRSTGKGLNTSTQSFVSVVSAFGHQSGLIYGMLSFANGKSGEAEALRSLVGQLGLLDKVLTMDAMHTQKKL
jgi:DDE_Tnp_1-associated